MDAMGTEIHQCLNGTESQRNPGPGKLLRLLLDTQVFFGVREPRGVLLEISWIKT